MGKRKNNSNIIILAVNMLLLFPFFSHAANEYSAFSTNAILKPNGELSVNEEFIYDFGTENKHGLYRNIPLVIDEMKEWYGISSIAVKDKNGEPYLFESNDSGNIAKIKIGDPKITLTGTHYYNLSYSLVGIGKKNSLDWEILSRLKEPVSKFQTQIYFPKGVPPLFATATCSIISIDNKTECLVTPLMKSNFVIGYKVYLENFSNQRILLSVRYGNGLIIPQDINISDKKNITISIIKFGISTVIIISIISILLYKRKSIKLLFNRIKRVSVSPDEYSYLERAISYKNDIYEEDVIATIIDLEERGYLALEPMATEVGANEFVDYSIEIFSREIENTSERLLLNSMEDTEKSLHEWIISVFPKYKSSIIDSTKPLLSNILILQQDVDLPKLLGFKIIKK